MPQWHTIHFRSMAVPSGKKSVDIIVGDKLAASLNRLPLNFTPTIVVCTHESRYLLLRIAVMRLVDQSVEIQHDIVTSLIIDAVYTDYYSKSSSRVTATDGPSGATSSCVFNHKTYSVNEAAICNETIRTSSTSSHVTIYIPLAIRRTTSADQGRGFVGESRKFGSEGASR